MLRFITVWLFIFAIKMPSHSFFGGPASLVGSQLPTYLNVGKQWLQSKIELQAASPNAKITDNQVAHDVNCSLFMRPCIAY